MTFGERVKHRREMLDDFSQEKLAKLVGYGGRAAINKVEKGIIKVPQDKVELYAKALQTSPAYLMGWVDDPELSHEETLELERKGKLKPQILAADNGSIDNNPVIINGEKRKDSDALYDNNTKPENSVSDDTNQDTVEIPILGDVAAGMGCFADNSIIGYETLPQAWINSHHEYILLRVKGDSMFPKFEENDLLLIKAQNSVDSGDYAVALIEDEVGVVKRIFYGMDWIELISVNPSYPVRRFEGADVQKIRVVGVVEKCIRNVK